MPPVFKKTVSFHGYQGSTALIFGCTDFHAHKMVLHTFVQGKLCVDKTLMLDPNLHHLIYNLLVAMVFPHIF